MQNKINFMFILISLVAVIWLSLLSYDNYQMQKHEPFYTSNQNFRINELLWYIKQLLVYTE